MNILVAVKRVIDYNVRVRVKSDGSGVDLEHVKMAMNPFDEIALEEAIRLKEAGLASEVLVVSIGPVACDDTLRSALAMGADRALRVHTSNPSLEALQVAKILKSIALEQNIDILIVGKQAIDDDCNQVGQMTSALLDWPQACFISSLLPQADGSWHAVREVDAGLETVSLNIPCVLTADLRLNEPRFIKLPNIMAARKKNIEVVEVGTLGVDLTPRLQCLNVVEPKTRQAGVRVSSVDELLHTLQHAMGASA